jgi:hypothetical protein
VKIWRGIQVRRFEMEPSVQQLTAVHSFMGVYRFILVFGLSAELLLATFCSTAGANTTSSEKNKVAGTTPTTGLRPGSHPPQREIEWREALACGTNATYIFLHCHGYNVPLGDVRTLVPITDRGSAFSDIWKATKQLGADTSLVQIGPSDLEDYALPIILLLEPRDSPYGHYTILTSISGKMATLVDPVSTVSASVDIGKLQRVWTGYALVYNQSLAAQAAYILLALISGGILAWVARVGVRRWISSESRVKKHSGHSLLDYLPNDGS